MSTHRKLMTGCAVAVLGFGLAACGGGGDNSARDSLQEQLDALQAAYDGEGDLTPEAITGLQTALAARIAEIGTADDADSLMGRLAAATARIGAADDADSLLGMIAAEQAEVTRLSGLLGDETTPDPASVRGMLAAANMRVDTLMGELADKVAEIGTADDPTSLMGMLAAERQTVTELRTRIAALETGTATDLLDPVRMTAMSASGDAATAETAADDAADEAETAMANRATIQTGEANSVADAYAARKAANTAMAEAAKALAAYEAAKMAGNVADATIERDKAVDAKDLAEAAQEAAEDARDEAVADSMAELKIDGTVKSAGETEIDATAGASVVTVGDGDDEQTTRTGQIKSLTPVTTGVGVAKGTAGVQDDPDTAGDQSSKHVQRVADRPNLPIGKVVDSADDVARLMIITHYAGTKNVYVYNQGSDVETGTKTGYISLKEDTVDGTNNVRLKSEGMFYAAGSAGGGEGKLDENSEVGATTKAVEVFSYTDVSVNDTSKKYVVLNEESKVDGTTTYTYINVDAEVTVKMNGGAEAFDTKVRAAIPEATEYEHIHFGVWAALGAAADDGDQEIADHGIGFAQNFSGGGMTGADMPNNGTGEYSGSWAATVETADEDGNGGIDLESGDVSVSADFGKGTIEADLDGLATLSGDVTGNTFLGTKVSDITHMSLDDEADFEGSFNGAFYGSKAAEAGGVFDFASDDGEGGAFRGAFGGQRTD